MSASPGAAREHARFVVGIDLGTTHTVVASAPLAAPRQTDEEEPAERLAAVPQVEIFPIEQLVAAGEVAPRALLPSLRYHPANAELPAGSATLPWRAPNEDADTWQQGVVGRWAQDLGAKVPARLVSSAKSWLSHGAVDRHAPILPWGAGDEVAKVSPVEASASYLRHIRAAWDHAHPDAPLVDQDVVLTVPASFDEAARALTLEAAKLAGLPPVRLVEEPQAAFYAWLDAHRDGLAGALGDVRLALVVDVGGGTTDLTLIQVELREGGPRLTRVAVGEHLMLGGDNMDLALAKLSEQRLTSGSTLPTARFTQLVQQCRVAKERLLASEPPSAVPIAITGSGSKLLGGVQRTDLQASEVEQIVLDGFFPEVSREARPKQRGSGFVEFGLPFVSDPGIPRHVAAFVAHHEALARTALSVRDARELEPAPLPVPDAILFNGGVFHAARLRARMRGILEVWREGPVRELANAAPDEAVARGAVAYGLARRGYGLRIGGGSARSYFLAVDTGTSEGKTGVCLLPRGSDEGETVALPERVFSLRLGKPVRFHLMSSTSEVRHVGAGELVDLDETLDDGDPRYRDLPPLAVVLEHPGKEAGSEIPVRLEASLTEVGTLELSCLDASEDAGSDPRRWLLELQLRGRGGDASEGAIGRVGQIHPRFAEATERIRLAYGKPKKGAKDELGPRVTKRLRPDLEAILGPRESWEPPLLRELFGALLAGLKRRRRTDDHERVWLNLVGYTLRPGFGYPLDDWRVKQLLPLVEQQVQHVAKAQNWSELWTLWRRVAGGLPPATQEMIADQIAWYLEPPSKKPRKRPPGPKALGVDDMIRLAGALEHLAPERKTQLGGWLVTRLDEHDDNPQGWWAVGRLGARVPFYGSAHRVVPAHVAAQWLDRALSFDLRDVPEAAFAATLLARASGDRERDLPESTREEVVRRLAAAGQPESWRAMVLAPTVLEAADERRIFGDALPPGLRLLE